MPISTLKKEPGTSRGVPGQNDLGPGTFSPGPLVPGLRYTQSPGTKKSWDLETPKVPGLKNWKSPGKMPTLHCTTTFCVQC